MKQTVILLLALCLGRTLCSAGTNDWPSAFPSAKHPWKRAGHEDAATAYRS